MSFLKENLFLTVLVVATLVAVVGLLFGNCGSAGAVQEALAERGQVRQSLQARRGGPKANPEINEKLRRRVEGIQASFREARHELLRWNSARFPVTRVPTRDGPAVPAFPPRGEAEWRRASLYVIDRFTQNRWLSEQYDDSLRQLFAELQVTRPPTQVEIEEEVRAAERMLETERALEGGEGAGAAGRLPVDPAEYDDPLAGPMGPIGPGARRRRP